MVAVPGGECPAARLPSAWEGAGITQHSCSIPRRGGNESFTESQATQCWWERKGGMKKDVIKKHIRTKIKVGPPEGG